MLQGVDRLATGAMLLASVLWAGSFIAMKLAIGVYGPMFVVFARLVLASVCLLLLVGRFKSERYQRGDWKLLLFMALCEPCLYFVCEAMALTYTSASQAGMIVAMLPLMVAVAAWFILKERPRPRVWFGFGLAILGVIWLTLLSETTEHAPNPMLGNFLEFLAMCCATGSMIALKILCTRFSPLFLTSVQAFTGCIFFLPIIFLPGTSLPDSIHIGAIVSILYLGIGVTIVAYWLYNFGISRIPAGQASIFVNLIPVITLFLGWLILGERLVPLQYAASFLVLAGVFLSQGDHRASRQADLTLRQPPGR